MAGVREAGTVERGGKDFGEGRRGRGEEEALYSRQYEINGSSWAWNCRGSESECQHCIPIRLDCLMITRANDSGELY